MSGDATPERIALAFPGQGVPAAEVAAVLEGSADPLVGQLADRLGTTDWRALDPTDTGAYQPAVYVASLVAARGAFDPADVSLVLGHSFGELTALAFAGALDPEAAVDLVFARGALTARAARVREGRMVAVMGFDAGTVEWVRRAAVAATGGILEVAAVNGRTQIVLSGDSPTVEAAVGLVAEAEGLAQVLPIGGGFHSPLMYPAVEPLRAELARAGLGRARVPVLSTIDLGVREDVGDYAEVLAQSLILPVQWGQALEALRRLDVDLVVDVGPGETLAKLGRRAKVVVFASLASLASSGSAPA